jgi:hypothetical protein
MLDFNAYLAAQYMTREAVNDSLPRATARPDLVRMTCRPDAIATRQWLSLTLRRLADVVEASSRRRRLGAPARRCGRLQCMVDAASDRTAVLTVFAGEVLA